MKITKRQLRRIIKEEQARLVLGDESQSDEAALREAVWELFLQDSRVSKQSLYNYLAQMGWLKRDVDNAIKLVADTDTRSHR